MRLILFVLLLTGSVALIVVLAAWFADRRMAQEADSWSFADAAKAPVVETALVLGTAPIGPEGGPNRYFCGRRARPGCCW
jgi:SanA protein